MDAPKQSSITTPKGFYAAGTTCGVKPSGRPDLALIVADRLCAAAGVFTRSRTPAAAVSVCRRHLRSGRAAAIVANSGIANAQTGAQGLRNAAAMCSMVSERLAHSPDRKLRGLSLQPRDVLVASTGTIGNQLPIDRIGRGIATLVGRLARGPSADAAAACAIMTTDLVPKSSAASVGLGRKRVRLGGICKGSGMIAPNMATMHAFITTDAAIAPRLLKDALRSAVAKSFNRISVDQHTSPSDTVMVLASGAAGNRLLSRAGPDLTRFRCALTDVCRDLAYQIVRDGEGATRVFRVRVCGARTEREGDRVAKTVVDSPMVKTAVHGADPNWGRITTAAGYSGAAIQPARMSLSIGNGRRNSICVYDRGMPADLTPAQQRRLQSMMKDKEITFTLDLGRGRAEVEWLGCDLSRRYVAINAVYTT